MSDDPTRDSYLTRSEERLTVGTEVVPVRRAVLRIETTTEEVMVPVTITRQHARLDYVDLGPDTAAPVIRDVLIGDAMTGAIGEWVTLTADEPLVTTRRVPVERVRLVTEWVTRQQDVHAQLSHEEITSDVVPVVGVGQHTTS